MNAHQLSQWIRDEHEKARALAERLHAGIAFVPKSRVEPWLSDVRAAFEHFRAHMTKHMALEEADGYMAPVLRKRPGFGQEVDRLAHEHQELSRIMDDIHRLFEGLTPEDRLLQLDCCARIKNLLSYVDHHEATENLLVVSVHSDDIGAED